jgi:SAM-dependent methyltransferase
VKCRSCNCNHLIPVLSLGAMPLANAFLTEAQLAEPEARYPLDLVYCPGCSLAQITETISPEVLFKNYFYLSSSAAPVCENAKTMTARMTAEWNLTGESLVVEIASNDGYLLRHYARRIPVLGIEPAANVADLARSRGVRTLTAFFNEGKAVEIKAEYGQADIIHANNVIAHVADLHSVVEGIAILLKPDGVAIVENAYVWDMMHAVEFDQIYHEHLCYYSATSFKWLFEQHGLDLVDIERILVHGGSLRCYFQPARGPGSMRIAGAKRVYDFLREEDTWVNDRRYYESFGHKIGDLRGRLWALLKQIKAAGKSIVGYGASAKSTTLLNYFRIGAETLDYMVDNIPLKQGRYTPGTHLKIYDPSKILETQPDYVLLLAWNFADHIVGKETEYRARGGQFIVPIPEVVIR